MGESRPMFMGSASVFATRVLGLVMGMATTVVLAASLGPAGLGSYLVLLLIPGAMLALLSWGLPSALTYHVGRGDDLDVLRTLALGLAIGVSLIVMVGMIALAPILDATVLAAAPPGNVDIIALAIPAAFLTSFCQSVILGRQELRAYNALHAFRSVALGVGQWVTVGVFDGGLPGALVTFVVINCAVAVIAAATMIRLAPFTPRVNTHTLQRMIGFGMKLQPASLAGYFSYRADVFLMSLLLRDPVALGVYGLAVSVAELCFYVPDAVSTVLFPRVASSSPGAAAMLVPRVTRITLLATSAAAFAIGVAAVIGFPMILPAYIASIAPTLVLLPAVVALSASKVLSGYLTGIGRPGPVSMVAMTTLVLNLILNIVLIPIMGPEGAATASLVSYITNNALVATIASSEARVSMRAMLVPRRDDVSEVWRLIHFPMRRGSNR